MGRFGDWKKGPLKEAEKFNVTYSLGLPDGSSRSGRLAVVTKGGKKMAGQRVHDQLKRKWPQAQITIRFVWKDGMTPGGIWLPPGYEWIDDEIEGRRKEPL